MAKEKEILLHFLRGGKPALYFQNAPGFPQQGSKVVTAYQVHGLEPGDVSELPDEALHGQLFRDKADSLLFPVCL